MYKLTIAAAILSLLLIGCGAAEPAPSQDAADRTAPFTLEGTKWKLLSFGLASTPVPARASISFNDGRYRGNGGCNSIGGSYTIEGSKITLTRGMSTMMACPELDLEHKYLQALSRVETFAIEGATLDLQSKGRSVLRFKAQ